MRLGAHYLGGGRSEFVVWAPFLDDVAVRVVAPEEQLLPMVRDERGYWRTTAEDVYPGTRYFYRIDRDKERPDPASHFQPEGVHGPSQIADHASFQWGGSGWNGIDLSRMIMYELHVGTFTEEGTFDAIIPRLDAFRDVGINAVELMPVAQFPGGRNWGYDGVYPYAVQESYGGPGALKRLVQASHEKGMAVILDVVYNHLGPEGNYLWDYGPYFTQRYRTPWGDAVNFDGAYSDEVRNFFIENALHWFAHYHVDALRLDAIHGIVDTSARPFLQELGEEVEAFSNRERKKVYLIAESDLNDARVIKPRELGGLGLDAQWCDDFHHSLHTLLTGESQGYYVGFGHIEHLVKSLKEGFVYSGQYCPYRKRSHGNSSQDRPGRQFVVSAQNHDQVGNRMYGERLTRLVSFEACKLAAAAILLAPYIPLFFMGEEYGEDVPFLYFVSHGDPGLLQGVREGRKEEFKTFHWKGEPPDPGSAETFLRSKIVWQKREGGQHAAMLEFYKRLIALRKETPALAALDKNTLDVWAVEEKRLVCLRRWRKDVFSEVFSVFNFDRVPVTLTASLPEGKWRRVLDSSDTIWHGPGTLLPKEMTPGDELHLHGHSAAVWMKS